MAGDVYAPMSEMVDTAPQLGRAVIDFVEVAGGGEGDTGAGGGPHIQVFDGTTLESGGRGNALLLAGDGNDVSSGAEGNDLHNGGDGAVAGASLGGTQFGAFSESEPFNFFAYDPQFLGGVRVAAGDINGDATPDIITSPGPGGGPHIRVFDGLTQDTIGSFFAYEPGFTGGVFVAAGDFDSDGSNNIITGPGAGGGPHVRVFSGSDGSQLVSFFAYDPQFLGGVRVAAGNINGNGTPDIITAPGSGGGPHIRVFGGLTQDTIGNFFAYEPGFTGGVFVAVGDIDSDALDNIIDNLGLYNNDGLFWLDTTGNAANKSLATRVYPVADLVLPLQSSGSASNATGTSLGLGAGGLANSRLSGGFSTGGGFGG